MQEIWKDIEGYEGLYQVSNKGRVKSLSRLVVRVGKPNYITKEKILKCSELKGTGYPAVSLGSNNNFKSMLVHRLVAQAFIPNPDNLPEINHIDNNKNNNHVNNLEWCNRLYNERQKPKHISGYPAKPIEQIDVITNEIIAEFESISDCERKLHINSATIRKHIENNNVITKFGNTFKLKWK